MNENPKTTGRRKSKKKLALISSSARRCSPLLPKTAWAATSRKPRPKSPKAMARYLRLTGIITDFARMASSWMYLFHETISFVTLLQLLGAAKICVLNSR